MIFFGKRLAELRDAAGMSQKQLAEKLGVSQQTISHVEKSTYPPLERVIEICDVLKVPVWRALSQEKDITKDFNISPETLELACLIDLLSAPKKNRVLKLIRLALEMSEEE